MLHIIWDLDGTLIDSQREIIYNLELAIQDAGIKAPEQIKQIKIGPTIDVILSELFPENKKNEIISNFRNRYDNSSFNMTKPFDRIECIISDTEHFTHHIITNKPDFATKRILEKLEWINKFRSITTPYSFNNHQEKKRSKTELFAKVIAEYGGSNSLFIGIGDMKADCIAAKENHIPALGVLWGTGTREELIGVSDCLFADAQQLGDFLHIEAGTFYSEANQAHLRAVLPHFKAECISEHELIEEGDEEDLVYRVEDRRIDILQYGGHYHE
jgi:phosphoglycolate phosphatase